MAKVKWNGLFPRQLMLFIDCEKKAEFVLHISGL